MSGYEGGPAFPFRFKRLRSDGWEEEWATGMSLRDWFAGQALAGIMAAQVRPFEPGDRQAVAASAWKLADTMLAARTPTDSAVGDHP